MPTVHYMVNGPLQYMVNGPCTLYSQCPLFIIWSMAPCTLYVAMNAPHYM